MLCNACAELSDGATTPHTGALALPSRVAKRHLLKVDDKSEIRLARRKFEICSGYINLRLPPNSTGSASHQSSSCPFLLPPPFSGTSGIAIMFTTKLVHPVKCCVRCPAPVSGLYCSHAKPVSTQDLYTVSTRFLRRAVYILLALDRWGPCC